MRVGTEWRNSIYYYKCFVHGRLNSGLLHIVSIKGLCTRKLYGCEGMLFFLTIERQGRVWKCLPGVFLLSSSNGPVDKCNSSTHICALIIYLTNPPSLSTLPWSEMLQSSVPKLEHILAVSHMHRLTHLLPHVAGTSYFHWVQCILVLWEPAKVVLQCHKGRPLRIW